MGTVEEVVLWWLGISLGAGLLWMLFYPRRYPRAMKPPEPIRPSVPQWESRCPKCGEPYVYPPKCKPGHCANQNP